MTQQTRRFNIETFFLVFLFEKKPRKLFEILKNAEYLSFSCVQETIERNCFFNERNAHLIAHHRWCPSTSVITSIIRRIRCVKDKNDV